MAVTTVDLLKLKASGEPITMITAYDFPSARLADAAGVDAILVGDTLGMVVLGHTSTVPVSMDAMVHHTAAVVRGVRHALVIADMPFLSYQINSDEAIRNAGRLLQEAGATAVKVEGGRTIAPTIRRLVEAGIPVCAHIGLTPQSVHQVGGFRLQGKTPRAARALIDDAQSIVDAGAFAVVLELVPLALASYITEQIPIPTIGIGAGVGCNGQVQVFHDLLGLSEPIDGAFPRHTRRYDNLGERITAAIAAYVADVRVRAFPTSDNTFEGPRELRDFVRDLRVGVPTEA
jgi:3-methyl-2-oxobutanoate hydroxymethyltransferase